MLSLANDANVGRCMALPTESWAFLFLLVLIYCAWRLTQIRKLVLGCYVELSTARWEIGKSIRAKNHLESLTPLGGQTKDLTE
jgi:hypothetical protein